jgi:hypothetical protein
VACGKSKVACGKAKGKSQKAKGKSLFGRLRLFLNFFNKFRPFAF